MDGDCDRCPAAAQVEWWRAEGRLLIALCRHHSVEHELSLTAAGFTPADTHDLRATV